MTTATITFRMDEQLRRYLEDRAKRHDRSMNKEFSAIMRGLQETEKTEEAQLGGTSSSVSE